MTTSAKPIMHSWIPRGRAKGGAFPNSTPYDSDADTLIVVQDCVIESNSWVPRPAEINPGFLPGLPGQTAQWASPVIGGVTYTYNSIALGNYWLGNPSLYTAMYGSCASGSLGAVRLIDPASAVVNYTGTTLRQVSHNYRWVFQFIKNRMYMSNGADRPMITNQPQSQLVGLYPSDSTYPWGVTAPITAPSYSITTGAITAGSLTVTNGSQNVVGIGTAFNTATVGQTIFILGVPYQIASIGGALALTVTSNYTGATGAVANGAWAINTGLLSWVPGAGYQYAYAYYDPISGHLSNMSPTVYVNDGPPKNVGVTVVLANIQQLLDANNANPDPRFTEIVIFRSAKGGGQLFPLAVLSNSAASPPYSYSDTQNDDTQLGTVGPGNLPGPSTSNNPPPDDIGFTTYWDGRFWGFSTSQPGLLFFSARADVANSEVSIGVAEECWPLVNTITIPDSDGAGTGLRVVGPSLMVESTRGIYVVTGGNPGSYRLSRQTSKGNGTSHFATCALPGEDANSADVLVHVGNDRRVYFLYGAGGDVSYSYPIQTEISITNDPQPSQHYLVLPLHNDQGTYLLFSGIGESAFAYDIERQTWFSWTLGYNTSSGNDAGVRAWCEGLMMSYNQFFIANGAGIWALKSHPPASLCYFTPAIVTQRFNPPGVERLDTKQLEEIYLYDIEGNATWKCLVLPDGRAPLLEMNVNTDLTTRSTLAEPAELYYSRNTLGTLAQGRTFQLTFIATPPNQSGSLFKLSEAKAIWVLMSEEGGVQK